MNNNTPGISGLPSPNSPNLSTHAVIDISRTFLIPNLFIKNGTSRKHSVSNTCDKESNALEFFTANVSASSGLFENDPRKVFA